MSDIKLGTNVIDDLKLGTLQVDKLYLGTNELWSSAIVTASPTVEFDSKTETSIQWKYTNTDIVAAHIFAKIDSGSYVDLGEVAAGGFVLKDWTGLTASTPYNTTCYAVGVPADYIQSLIVGPSSPDITTDSYTVTATPSYDSKSMGETTARIYYQNNDTQIADINITLNGVTETVLSVASGATGYTDFTGLTYDTLYGVSATAQASGKTISDASVTTNVRTDDLDTTAVPSYLSSSVTETTARVYYTNEDDDTADIDITMNGVTETAQNVVSGGNGYVDFSGLTYNTTYPVTAKAQASGEHESAASGSTNITTDDLDTTAVPSWVSNTLITHNSVRVTYTNNDDDTATIYITVNGVEKFVSIGAGATGYQDFNGLIEDTAYTSTAKAQASGEYESASSSSTGTSFTTAVQTQTDTPTINEPFKVTTWKYTVANDDASSATIYSDYDGTNPPTTTRGTIASGANTAVIDTGSAIGGFTIYARAQASGLTISDTVSVYVES